MSIFKNMTTTGNSPLDLCESVVTTFLTFIQYEKFQNENAIRIYSFRNFQLVTFHFRFRWNQMQLRRDFILIFAVVFFKSNYHIMT